MFCESHDRHFAALILGLLRLKAPPITSKRPHPADLHSSSVCMPWNLRRTRFDPNSSRTQRFGNASKRIGGVSPRTRKVKVYAVNSTPGSSHRCGCSTMAGQSLHSDAAAHQLNFKRVGGNSRV